MVFFAQGMHTEHWAVKWAAFQFGILKHDKKPINISLSLKKHQTSARYSIK